MCSSSRPCQFGHRERTFWSGIQQGSATLPGRARIEKITRYIVENRAPTFRLQRQAGVADVRPFRLPLDFSSPAKGPTAQSGAEGNGLARPARAITGASPQVHDHRHGGDTAAVNVTKVASARLHLVEGSHKFDVRHPVLS